MSKLEDRMLRFQHEYKEPEGFRMAVDALETSVDSAVEALERITRQAVDDLVDEAQELSDDLEGVLTAIFLYEHRPDHLAVVIQRFAKLYPVTYHECCELRDLDEEPDQ